MNITKNGKITSLRVKNRANLTPQDNREKEDFKRDNKQPTLKEVRKKEENPFWEDCKENSSISKDKINDNSKDDFLTFNDEKLNISKDKASDFRVSQENSINVHENSNFKEKNNMTREEKFRLMLEKYAESSPENVVSDKAEKAEKALKRCYRLYEQGKIKNEVTRLINQKNMELREQKELSECTFKPKTNKFNRKSSVRDFDEKRIYDRAINWKKRKIEKIDREKASQQREIDGYGFKPKLSSVPSAQIFDPKKNLINDFTSRNFLLRLENARMEEKNKKEMLSKGGKNLSSKWLHRSTGALRSVSQDNTICYNNNIDLNCSNIGDAIKNLHNELHNFNIDEDDIEI